MQHLFSNKVSKIPLKLSNAFRELLVNYFEKHYLCFRFFPQILVFIWILSNFLFAREITWKTNCFLGPRISNASRTQVSSDFCSYLFCKHEIETSHFKFTSSLYRVLALWKIVEEISWYSQSRKRKREDSKMFSKNP